nr:unnamed protein product [Spirometra erinaceieuropaei]
MDPDFDFSFGVTEPSLSVHKTLLSLNSNLPDSKFSMRDALSALPTDPHEHPTESSQTPKQRIQDVTNFPTTLLTIELKAPTSPATRIDEDSLTYLNQGQSYDLRLSESFGEERMLIKSIVRICFHEEKMQFMESKHLELWQSAHPGERLLDIVFNALYLYHQTEEELRSRLSSFLRPSAPLGSLVLRNSDDIPIVITDEVVSQFEDQGCFTITLEENTEDVARAVLKKH